MKPLLRGHFHQGMFFVMLGAGIPLIMKTRSSDQLTSVLIYVLCALAMFGVSALYHRINWQPKTRMIWRRMDHSCIFLMIAGTFTPVALLGLERMTAIKLLMTIWIVCGVGILQSIIFVNMPKYVSAIIYIVAGNLILPYLSEIGNALGSVNIVLIISGGVLYSLGAICYATKWPKLNPAIFSYHEVFHLFVNFAALLHYFVIWNFLK